MDNSFALKVSKYWKPVDETNPKVYLLPLKELKITGIEHAQLRQYVIAEGTQSTDLTGEKTIIIFGEQGSGKRTMIDVIINYIKGVTFKDSFRLTVFNKEERRHTNQGVSNTQRATVYRVPPTKGGRLKYTLNIIDAFGIYDTAGESDTTSLRNRLLNLLSSLNDCNAFQIDAVCFVARAQHELTEKQKKIHREMALLRGEHKDPNTCVLVSFADIAVDYPLKCPTYNFKTMEFHNSALFAKDESNAYNDLYSKLWELTEKNCDLFINFISR